jgi:hypothetical protein
MHLTRRRQIRKAEDGRSPDGRMDQEGDERKRKGGRILGKETHNSHGLLWNDPSSNLHIIIRPRSSLSHMPTPLSIRYPGNISLISVIWVRKELKSWISALFSSERHVGDSP